VCPRSARARDMTMYVFDGNVWARSQLDVALRVRPVRSATDLTPPRRATMSLVDTGFLVMLST
jgi:hypothetical protein